MLLRLECQHVTTTFRAHVFLSFPTVCVVTLCSLFLTVDSDSMLGVQVSVNKTTKHVILWDISHKSWYIFLLFLTWKWKAKILHNGEYIHRTFVIFQSLYEIYEILWRKVAGIVATKIMAPRTRLSTAIVVHIIWEEKCCDVKNLGFSWFMSLLQLILLDRAK